MSSFERWPTVSGSTYLVAATASASANTKGSYAQVTASTTSGTSDWYVYVELTTTNRAYLVDIATGGSGSEVVQIANMPAINNGQGSTVQITSDPFYANSDIAGSTRIAARCQASGTGSQGVQLYVMLRLNGTAGRAAPITSGASTATSKGAAIDAGGVANTKGSYTQVDASLSATVGIVQLSVNFLNSGPSFGQFAADLSTGAAASEVVLVPDIGYQSDNALTIIQPTNVTLNASISSGTRVAMRSQSTITDATDRVFNVVMVSQTLPSGSAGGAWAFA